MKRNYFPWFLIFSLIFIIGCTQEADNAKNEKTIAQRMVDCQKQGGDSPQKMDPNAGGYGSCYSKIAIEQKNISICQELGPLSGKYTCILAYAFEKDDLSICDLTEESIKNSCYHNIALKRSDPTICSKITNFEGKRDSCFFKLAYMQLKPEFCQNIETANYVDLCKSMIDLKGKYNSSNIECTKKGGTRRKIEYCIMNMDQENICNQFSDENSLAYCGSVVSAAFNLT